MNAHEASPPPYELARRMLDAIGWDGNNFRLRDPVANAIAAEVERINGRARPGTPGCPLCRSQVTPSTVVHCCRCGWVGHRSLPGPKEL